MRWHRIQEWTMRQTREERKINRTTVVNSSELEDMFPGWYNLPYCLATWPLGNNSTVCCQSNTGTQTHRARRDAPAPARAHSSHRRRRRARENTELKLLRPAHSLTHTQSSITLNWFLPATNGEGGEPLYTCQIKLGRERETERDRTTSPQKEEKSDPLRVHHSRTQMQPEQTKDNADITLTTSRVPARSSFRLYPTRMQTHVRAHPRVPLIHLLSAKRRLFQSEPHTFALLEKKNIFSNYAHYHVHIIALELRRVRDATSVPSRERGI